MFQPQTTPYSPFASYGGATGQDQTQNTFASYQPPGLGPLSGGPIEFDNPIFSPVASYPALPANLHQSRYNTMDAPATDDLVAQETLARAYQPELKVCTRMRLWHEYKAYLGAGSSGGAEEIKSGNHRRVCKGRSHICRQNLGKLWSEHKFVRLTHVLSDVT